MMITEQRGAGVPAWGIESVGVSLTFISAVSRPRLAIVVGEKCTAMTLRVRIR